MVCWHRLAHTEDEAKAHVANSTMEILQELFGDCKIFQNGGLSDIQNNPRLTSIFGDFY
jgi:hypothetical protein